MTQLLKKREVAARLGVAEGTIEKWIYQKRLPVVRIGRAVRIKAEDLEATIQMGYTPVRQVRGAHAG